MAAEIHIFNTGNVVGAQVARHLVQTATTTFTSVVTGEARIYANGAPVLFTLVAGMLPVTIPAGTYEYLGVTAGKQYVVA